MPTLKELLKPPFVHSGDSTIIYDSGYRHRLIDIGGWKSLFEKYENGAELQDEFVDIVTAALNEKWERDFGERKLWSYLLGFSSRWICPECNKQSFVNNDPYTYCPHCGQRLLPPEGT
jgi:endogenous inhibitor of DNA gyrase (YacG/DUF329 family)